MKTDRTLCALFTLTVAAVTFFSAISDNVTAGVVVEEQFVYEAGVNIDTQDGGIGFDGPWVSTISHGRIYEVQEAGLTFSSLQVAGNSLSRLGSAGRAQAHRLISEDAQAALTVDETTMWFSVLFQEPIGQYRHTSFLFGTEAFTTGGAPALAMPGDGFGFTIQAAPDGAGQGNGSINALAFHDATVPIVVAGTYTPVPQEATSLIVGRINWHPEGTPDELFLYNVTDLSVEPEEIDDAFAAITDLDFDQTMFDTIAMWDSNNGIIDEIRFGTSFSDVIALRSCPYSLNASGGPDGVTLQWNNPDPVPESVTIFRNGEEIASGSDLVDPPSYADSVASPGLLEYELVFSVVGDEACEPLTATYNACITGLEAVNSDGMVSLTWANNLGYDGVEVRCNGEIIATVAGDVEEYVDIAPPAEGIALYEVAPTNGACDAASVEIALGGILLYETFEEPDITEDNRGNPWQGIISGFNVDTVLPGWVGVNRYTYICDKGINEEGNEQFINPFGDQVAMVFDNNPGEPQDSSLTTTSDLLDAVLTEDTIYQLSFNVASGFSQSIEYHVQLLAIDDSDPLFPIETVLAEVRTPIASNDLAENSDIIEFIAESGNEHLDERIAVRLRKGDGDWHYHACYDNIILQAKPTVTEVQFLRGDVNADGDTNLTDAVAVLSYYFADGTEPTCLDAADANDDGGVNIADAVAILAYFFSGAGDLPAPFPECGVDPTTDGDPLECQAFAPCEQ